MGLTCAWDWSSNAWRRRAATGRSIATIPRWPHEGKNPLILDSKPPSIPLEQYAYNETRYRMLKQSDPARAEELMREAEAGRARDLAALSGHGRAAGARSERASAVRTEIERETLHAANGRVIRTTLTLDARMKRPISSNWMEARDGKGNDDARDA